MYILLRGLIRRLFAFCGLGLVSLEKLQTLEEARIERDIRKRVPGRRPIAPVAIASVRVRGAPKQSVVAADQIVAVATVRGGVTGQKGSGGGVDAVCRFLDAEAVIHAGERANVVEQSLKHRI